MGFIDCIVVKDVFLDTDPLTNNQAGQRLESHKWVSVRFSTSQWYEASDVFFASHPPIGNGRVYHMAARW